MKIIFARHGESVANVLRVFSNFLSHPLTAKGIHQAQELSQRLQGQSFHQVYTSPVQRAVETCQIICAALAQPFTITEALREYDVGKFEGTSDPAGWQVYEDVLHSWMERQEWDLSMPGGETFNDMRRRFIPFIQSLVAENHLPEAQYLLVSHGGLLRCMLPQIAANITPAFSMQHPIGNTETVTLETQDGGLICTDWCGNIPSL